MYVASYVVHHRRIRWQAGARWYLGYLFDGDPSSNNLSWQWVAGTFSASPYIFNRENLERYTAGRSCRVCPLASGGCPFDADYATLRTRLFQEQTPPLEKKRVDLSIAADVQRPPGETHDAVVWVHPDAMSDESVAHRAAPNAPVIAAGFDAMHARDRWSAQRRAFVDASLATMRIDAPATGPDAEAVVAFARANGARRVVTTATPDPLVRDIAAEIARSLPVTVLDPPPFVTISRRVNLKRFSQYWKYAENTAFGFGGTRRAGA
jgi:deoxyribodipyrimidine photo-lyase